VSGAPPAVAVGDGGALEGGTRVTTAADAGVKVCGSITGTGSGVGLLTRLQPERNRMITI
jgi:hypothetical protein